MVLANNIEGIGYTSLSQNEVVMPVMSTLWTITSPAGELVRICRIFLCAGSPHQVSSSVNSGASQSLTFVLVWIFPVIINMNSID